MSEEKKSINDNLKDVSGGNFDLFKLEVDFSKKDTKIDNSKTAVIHGNVGGDITMKE